ncbi:hypothetical protein [Solilutibacter pythonis]|uniref:hypothetical protein n=1 Tax=Solilutibacter pythonis TaxID=2483112 RepID=UPI001FE362FE|nr:hypothetical protein [Lysobacter pythonis]
MAVSIASAGDCRSRATPSFACNRQSTISIGLSLLLSGVGDATAVEGTAGILTNELAGFAGIARDKLIPAELRFSGDQLRIEFTGEDGRDYTLLRNAPAQPMLLLDREAGTGLPVPAGRINLFYDPGNPCAAMGMMSDCRKLASGIHSGRNAVHWRYRGSNRRGPGGSNVGDMWLDQATGFVLAYTGERSGSRQKQLWIVMQVRYAPQEEEAFLPPRQSSRRD